MAETAEKPTTTALATKEVHALLNRKDVLAELRKVLPDDLSPERLTRISLTVIQKSPHLKECTPLSLLACVVECAQLRLDPDPLLGEVYFVPYKKQATIQVGYKGFAKLAFNTGDIHKITAHVVRRNEKFKYTAGTAETIVHDPKDHGPEKDDSTWTHAYAVAFFRDGHTDQQVLERAEVFRRRSRSRAFQAGKKDSPWFTDTESMWKKTAIRALATRLPKSTTDNRLARAAKLDELSDLGLLTPTTTGFEIAEDSLLLNEDSGETEKPIQPSKEIEKKAPAGRSKKGRKPEPTAEGKAGVPKANIPRDPIDVKPESVKTPAKPDPNINNAQLKEIYETGDAHGSWSIDAVQAWVKKRFGCKVVELRVSQLPAVMHVMKNGE
jgi:recombination protein RecT